jgi:tRNA(His) 5'-end guanylyltransferase
MSCRFVWYTRCSGTGALVAYGVCPLCDGLSHCEAESLEQSAENITSLLKRYQPVLLPDMDPKLHYLAPHVPKVTWTALGDLVAARERGTSGCVPGTHWISLRLDGSGFSKTVRVLRKKGILEPAGFSETFAACMQSSLRALMEHFNGRLGYTQSDEMILFIAPMHVVRGEQQSHLRNGRVTKLTSLAASYVTAHFIMQLGRHCERCGVGLEELAHILPHFDCRLGHYASWEEARGLLLWRAYDCSVNGVSDAVYQIKGSSKEVQGLGRQQKVDWLWKQGRLPLPRHQAYGTVLVRVKRVIEGHNPKLQTTVTTLRSVIEQVDGPVLELVRTDSLIPEDDVLTP